MLAASFLVIEQKSFSILFADSSKLSGDNRDLSTVLTNLTSGNSGEVTLLNFWASWCSPCMRELPSLNRLHALYKDKGLDIITINTDYENQERLIKNKE